MAVRKSLERKNRRTTAVNMSYMVDCFKGLTVHLGHEN